MALTDYEEALKLGKKAYKAALAAGRYPYLPALDDYLADKAHNSVMLGLRHIPVEFVVGTKNSSRGNSFADNFMPIMEEQTEFGYKWKSLCESHLEEGIRDPIKVYEFLNRYYVEEGNKRFSVLKYFGAVSIPAEVTRILPDEADDLTDQMQRDLYRELIEFDALSGVNFIEFSKSGSTLLLQKYMGKAPGETWTKEERQALSSAYYYFRGIYLEVGGKGLSSTVGDAFAAYCEIYGMEAIRKETKAVIKKNLAHMWEEIALQEEENPVQVITDPAEEKKKGPLSKLLSPSLLGGTPKRKKVGFVHDKNADISGWTYNHELGRLYVEGTMSDLVETCVYNDAMEEDPAAVIEQAISDGCEVIFTTSPRLMPASLAAAVEHQDRLILNCSINSSHRYVRSYYSRMYEAKFVIGAIAGALSENGRLGYICDYPIYGQIAGINAFALGARMVNPEAKVYLEWSSVADDKTAMQRLLEQEIHLISAQDMDHYHFGLHRSSFGLVRVNGEEKEMLAMPTWEWGIYYESMIRQALDKTLASDYSESNRAVNYFRGMDSGVIDLYLSERLPSSVQRLASFMKTAIKSNVCPVFEAHPDAPDGTSLEVEEIIHMNELVENVIGSIPAYEELTPIGQSTVDVSGVEGSRAEDERKNR